METRVSPDFVNLLAALIEAWLITAGGGEDAGGKAAPAPAATGLAPSKLARVLTFVEEHIGEPLPIERLAASVCMSPFHFARLFKRATGQTPHNYLTARRMERAKELLRNDGLPLVHVAFSVGFQTQGHFTEVFHRHAGITPRRFRLSATRPPPS
jgi:AraC family transcriptional regulator